MQHPSTAPGPEIGWGIGLIGLLASAMIGWLMDVGVGFLLLLLIFWGAVGTLFAFLVERSTIEEHDRVDELQNTRLDKLGTLAPPAPEPKPGLPKPQPEPNMSEPRRCREAQLEEQRRRDHHTAT
ncbi:unannotated protein [freshwater metagenome]|jgi:hypothetical protein|uniref:Unannotated protein n=1 Tax=freshwater metagenome TaxID=449393 RepID=A0A6J7JGE2_9ZZZZ